MKFHAMRQEFHSDLGKVVYSCTVCTRCVEIDADGALRILDRGDPLAVHRGGLMLSAEAVDYQPPPPKPH